MPVMLAGLGNMRLTHARADVCCRRGKFLPQPGGEFESCTGVSTV